MNDKTFKIIHFSLAAFFTLIAAITKNQVAFALGGMFTLWFVLDEIVAAYKKRTDKELKPLSEQ